MTSTPDVSLSSQQAITSASILFRQSLSSRRLYTPTETTQRRRHHRICVWSSIIVALVWLGFITLIWFIQCAPDVRIVLILVATVLCLLPFSIRGMSWWFDATTHETVYPGYEQSPARLGGTHLHGTPASDAAFVSCLLSNELLARGQTAHIMPSIRSFISGHQTNESKKTYESNIHRSASFTRESLPHSDYSLWTAQYARRSSSSSTRSYELSLLLQWSDGILHGYGDGRTGMCELDGEYALINQQYSDIHKIQTRDLMLVACRIRFDDHDRHFRGVCRHDLSLGVQGVWTSKRCRRLDWLRLWPRDTPVSTTALHHIQLFHCTVSINDGCIICCRDIKEAPLVVVLSCGHILACRECLDGIASCPTCRTPISRICTQQELAHHNDSRSVETINSSAQDKKLSLTHVIEPTLPSSSSSSSASSSSFVIDVAPA